MKVRVALTGILSIACGFALFAGIQANHLGLITILAACFLAEGVFWKWRFFSSRKLLNSLRRFQNSGTDRRLLGLFYENTDHSSSLLFHEIQGRLRLNPPSREREGLVNFLSLLEFRKLVFESPKSAKEALQEAFIPRQKKQNELSHIQNPEFLVDDFSIQDVADAATVVAGIFWKVYRISIEEENPLSKPAKELLEVVYPQAIETLMDSIQREGGVPFLILNLISREQWEWAKPLGQRLLTSELSLEEETRVCLYWMTEIQWFTRRSIRVTDFETTIRYLYHLCFINPERAGFLEIDSQFFSQFETVNELAKEGFLFKETLVDRVLHLWGEQTQYFDGLFRETVQILTQQRSKIYQERDSWVKWWDREKEGFEKEYLFILEGNLHYASRQFKEALEFYNKSLEINPHLRSALLNRLFCLAKLRDVVTHQKSVDEILNMKSLYPSALSVVGNSFLLLGKDDEAERIYAELTHVEGWARKTDYYRSTFCFENGLFEKALEFALLAHQRNPEDMSMGFHLSQCYSAVGKKVEALEILKKLGGTGPQWLNYYKFTLERDSGLWGEAHQTLLQIPIEYFDDPDELEAALDFAKNSSDLGLLRRLKSRR